MNIDAMRSFIVLAEELNYSRASERLYISQPTLSVRISNMEKELGVPLFSRSHQAVLLTTYGAKLLPEVREIVERIDNLAALAKETQGTEILNGTLRIGIDPTDAREQIESVDKVLQLFREEYPEMQIDLAQMDFNEIESKLLEQKIDAAVVVLHEMDSFDLSIKAVPIEKDEIVVAGTNISGMSLADILMQRRVILIAGDDRWNTIYSDYLLAAYGKTKPDIITSVPTFFWNIRYNNAVAFLPAAYVRKLQIDNLEVVPLDFPYAKISLSLIWNVNNMNPGIQLLLHKLRTTLHAAPAAEG